MSSAQARVSSYFTSLIEERGISAALGPFDSSLGGLRDFYSFHPAGRGGEGREESEAASASDEVAWLEYLSGAVDAHHWVLKSGYLTAQTLFSDREGEAHLKVKIKSEGGVKRKAQEISQADPRSLTQLGVFQHVKTFTAACMLNLGPRTPG